MFYISYFEVGTKFGVRMYVLIMVRQIIGPYICLALRTFYYMICAFVSCSEGIGYPPPLHKIWAVTLQLIKDLVPSFGGPFERGGGECRGTEKAILYCWQY